MMPKSVALDDLAGEVITVEQLASVLCIGRNAAYGLVAAGRVYSIRVGRSIRLPKAAVRKLLQIQGERIQ